MTFRLLITAVLSLMLLFSGCTHKDIICPGSMSGKINVVFDWSHAQMAHPDGMTLYFYALDQNSLNWRFDIAGRDGGTVELPSGRYRLLTVNNDLPGVIYSGSDEYSTLSATARSSGSGIAPTGMVYAANITYLEVTPCGITYRNGEGAIKECPANVLRCTPDSIATVYDITVDDIKGLNHVQSATLTLRGIATSKAVASLQCDGNANLSATADIDTALPGSFHAVTTGLGTSQNTDSITLAVTVARTDGKRIEKNFDISDQIKNSINPRYVLIHIQGIEIPEGDIPDKPGGDPDVGLDVDVDGWEEVNIYL